MLADVFTPVGIYLRLRDKFRDTILLESTDFHAGDNNFSIIGINAVAGIEVRKTGKAEMKFPAAEPKEVAVGTGAVTALLESFLESFELDAPAQHPINIAQGVFGYTAYDALPFFENIRFAKKPADLSEIPLMRYRLYQYVIILDHYKDELYLCENHFAQVESRVQDVEQLIRSKDVPSFPFAIKAAEEANMTDADYEGMVKKGIAACARGDVFQIVLSRRFSQAYTGDDFNVYRALRSVNPSPYLFYFDYGDYHLFGSSPESQVIIKNGKAIVHPIAGTFKRSGDDETDKQLAIALEENPKETAEHVMLVDLARNDLSRVSSGVEVSSFKKVHYYSHVIHLVSEVQGKLPEAYKPFEILSATFPAGTLSGAPKYKAMQIIDELEPTARGYYGGAIGFIGLNGSCNHAIMIRTFLSRQNTLLYQAGAGVVINSDPTSELQEVQNKLGALKKAIALGAELFSV